MFNDAHSDYNPFDRVNVGNTIEYNDCGEANSCCGAADEYDNGLDSTLSFSVREGELVSNREFSIRHRN